MLKFLFHFAIALAIADLALAAAKYGFNYDTVVVQPGQTYYAEEFGDLGLQKSATLACRYWRGLGSSFAIFQYGATDDGKTACPLFLKLH